LSARKILLLSAYDAYSHQYWHQQLVAMFPDANWQLLTLKDRYFSWRMGGNALAFKAHFDKKLKLNYDLLIATSMTDLSTLRSFYPHLTQIPNLLYFHENQFGYPANSQQQGLLEIQLRSILSALSADRIAFNSNYNQQTFFDGIKDFIKKMPDGIPKDLVTSFNDKSVVIPVPIKSDCKTSDVNRDENPEVLKVVWNHRWEHDKGPETLLALMRLCEHNARIKFHIIGQQFRNSPSAFESIDRNHRHQCLSFGFLKSRAQYIKTLQGSDVVLSTALHDFQGIAMLEAVACGCKPIAPKRLVYPEQYPAKNLYSSNPKKPEKEASEIHQLLLNHQQLDPPLSYLNDHNLATLYAQWLGL
jgi:glycosyltransferase involved in cell wall biosynthesis